MIAPAEDGITAESPVTIKEWMVATGKSRRTVYAMLADGTLPSYQTRHGRITPRPWFRRWLRGEWVPEVVTSHRPTPQFIHSARKEA